jgi:biotin synthase
MTQQTWTKETAAEVYSLSFPELIYRAQTTHRENFPADVVQRSTLLSIKTGGCSEDCKYCPQSAHYDTGLDREKLLAKEVVMHAANKAKEEGSTRFCMGAAWRNVRDGKEFEQILDIVRSVHDTGLEVCCTLGMLSEEQAVQLKDAGCYAYNHNLDTSPEYYGEVITTRTYEDRLDTLKNARNAGMTVCCGGIVGMGESEDDRLGLLVELANQTPPPESVPINMLVKVEGTPLVDQQDVDPIDFVRMIATARIMMPQSAVRLSAGRNEMSDEMQALCFIAGANSIFAGEKLLTTPNPGEDKDTQLIEKLGMQFKQEQTINECSTNEKIAANCS